MAADRETAPLTPQDMPRARRLLTLEFGSREEFEDPRFEYRRLFSELLGTFMWVYVVGPLAGAAIAVGFAWILRGRGGDPVSRAAGSGRLSSGLREETAALAHKVEAHESARRKGTSTASGEEDAPDSTRRP